MEFISRAVIWTPHCDRVHQVSIEIEDPLQQGNQNVTDYCSYERDRQTRQMFTLSPSVLIDKTTQSIPHYQLRSYDDEAIVEPIDIKSAPGQHILAKIGLSVYAVKYRLDYSDNQVRLNALVKFDLNGQEIARREVVEDVIISVYRLEEKKYDEYIINSPFTVYSNHIVLSTVRSSLLIWNLDKMWYGFVLYSYRQIKDINLYGDIILNNGRCLSLTDQ